MPKKRSHKFAYNTDHANVRSPLSTTTDGATNTFNCLRHDTINSSSSSSSRTVNERLAQLRAEQAPRPTLERRREIEMVATAHSMPPDLRNILHIPETAPPPPRAGSRRPRGLMRLAPPGPAAPRSWLSASLHAPAHVKAHTRDRMRIDREKARLRDRPDGFSRLSNLEGSHTLPAKDSLVDYVLKAMARNWDFVAEYEQYNLAALPVPLKAVLLSYLSVYGPEESMSVEDLRVLFFNCKELAGGTGSEEVARLDLTGLLNQRLSVADLGKYIYSRPEKSPELTDQMKTLATDDLIKSNDKIGQLLNSWEDEDEINGSSVPISLSTSRFPNLTRLSLANAGAYSSWRQLLTLSTRLSTLTHLSLAYWPLPTTTPNSKTAFIQHKHANIAVGGSHYYSALDQDWREAANILRRISNNTYCLEWIDLEGCNEWLTALTWTSSNPPAINRWSDRTFRRGAGTPSSSAFEEDIPTGVTTGIDWNGSWSQVKYVNVSQGFIPTDAAAVRAIPAGVVACDLLLYLRENEDTGVEHGEYLESHHVLQWLQREKEARRVASAVRLLRTSAKEKYCMFDHGWIPPRGGPTKENKD